MSRIVPVPSPPQSVAATFQEIEKAFGGVPNLFKTYAHHPPLLRANWNKVKAVMMEGSLTQNSTRQDARAHALSSGEASLPHF